MSRGPAHRRPDTLTPCGEQWAARADFVAVTAADQRLPLSVRIGVPVQTATGEWECALSLEGLHNTLVPMSGEDALQALGLAWNLVGSLLRRFEALGGRVEYPTGLRVPLETYFAPDVDGPAS